MPNSVAPTNFHLSFRMDRLVADKEKEEEQQHDDETTDYQAMFQQFMLSGNKKEKNNSNRMNSKNKSNKNARNETTRSSPKTSPTDTTTLRRHASPPPPQEQQLHQTPPSKPWKTPPSKPWKTPPSACTNSSTKTKKKSNVQQQKQQQRHQMELALDAYWKRLILDWLSVDTHVGLVVESIADLCNRIEIASHYVQYQQEQQNSNNHKNHWNYYEPRRHCTIPQSSSPPHPPGRRGTGLLLNAEDVNFAMSHSLLANECMMVTEICPSQKVGHFKAPC